MSGARPGSAPHLPDLETGTLTSLDEALGTSVDRAVFLDSGTLLLIGGEDACSAWVWDLSAGALEQTAGPLHRYDSAGGQGVLDLGGRYALEMDEDGFVPLASKEGYVGISAGFSAAVLATDSIAVLFGDLTDSIFDFVNGQRLSADFTQVTVQLRDGSTLELTLTIGRTMSFRWNLGWASPMLYSTAVNLRCATLTSSARL